MPTRVQMATDLAAELSECAKSRQQDRLKDNGGTNVAHRTERKGTSKYLQIKCILVQRSLILMMDNIICQSQRKLSFAQIKYWVA